MSRGRSASLTDRATTAGASRPTLARRSGGHDGTFRANDDVRVALVPQERHIGVSDTGRLRSRALHSHEVCDEQTYQAGPHGPRATRAASWARVEPRSPSPEGIASGLRCGCDRHRCRLTGCSSPRHQGPRPASTLALEPSTTTAPGPRPETTASLLDSSGLTIPTLAVGTPVDPSGLGVRTFVSSTHGFALWMDLQHSYPAGTTDGGRTWRIDGPVFHVDAAQGPLAVTEMGAMQPDTAFSWGPGAPVVYTTSDGGAHWWSAFLGDGALALAGNVTGELTAVVASDYAIDGTYRTEVYQSSDGGHHWTLDRS